MYTPEGAEVFTGVEFASFDEAKKAVDAGVRDRNLELEQKYPGWGKYSNDSARAGMASILVPPGRVTIADDKSNIAHTVSTQQGAISGAVSDTGENGRSNSTSASTSGNA